MNIECIHDVIDISVLSQSTITIIFSLHLPMRENVVRISFADARMSGLPPGPSWEVENEYEFGTFTEE